MCTEQQIAQVGLGAKAFGAVAAFAGTYQKSEAEKRAYEINARVSENNATIADMQAKDALDRASKTEQALRLKTAALKGTQRAGLAARGIDLGEGSALSILTDTDLMGERDAMTVRDNGAKEAWGYNQKAANLRSDASLLQWRADTTNPSKAAFGVLLSGAGSVAESWYKYRKSTTGFPASGGNQWDE